MLADKEFLEKLLQYIGENLNHEVEGMLIGGNAMIFYGLRGQTKDIDLVFFDKHDIAAITQIIKSHPLFKKSEITKGVPYEVNPELLKGGEPTVIQDSDLPRFDLFYKSIFSIEARKIFEKSDRILRFDLLKLKLIKPEDLIFLKGAVGRPVDKKDIVRIIENLEIDWDYLLKFVKEYHKKNKKIVWLLLGTLYDINEKNGDLIPKYFLEELVGFFGMKL